MLCVICQLNKPGRLGDTADELPTIQNGSKVADLVWDPFDNTRLVVGQYNLYAPLTLAPIPTPIAVEMFKLFHLCICICMMLHEMT